MRTSEVLNRAADLIEERGWASGEGWEHEKGGPLCLEGGILAAIGGSYHAGDHFTCPAYVAVRGYLADRTSMPPFMWNDKLPHERVMAAIDRGESLTRSLADLWAEADEWASREVIGVLRACALIEAAREDQDAAWQTYAENVVAS